MAKKSRPALPGQKKRIPRKGWRELRQEHGAKKAKALLAEIKPGSMDSAA